MVYTLSLLQMLGLEFWMYSRTSELRTDQLSEHHISEHRIKINIW